MNDNPYQSPKSEPEVEERPEKPPNRYGLAAAFAFMAVAGLALWQAIIVEYLRVFSEIAPVRSLTDSSAAQMRAMLPVYALIASPVGLLMAWWALRAPKSKCALAIAMLMAVGWFVPALIGVLFFGFN